MAAPIAIIRYSEYDRSERERQGMARDHRRWYDENVSVADLLNNEHLIALRFDSEERSPDPAS